MPPKKPPVKQSQAASSSAVIPKTTTLASSSTSSLSGVTLDAAPSSEKFAAPNVVYLPSCTMDVLRVVVGSLVEVQSSATTTNTSSSKTLVLAVLRDSEQDRLRKSSFARFAASTLVTLFDDNNNGDIDDDDDDDNHHQNDGEEKVTIKVHSKCDLDDARTITIRLREQQHEESNNNNNNNNNKIVAAAAVTDTVERVLMFERSIPRDSGVASIVFEGMIVTCSNGMSMFEMEIVSIDEKNDDDDGGGKQQQQKQQKQNSSKYFTSSTKVIHEQQRRVVVKSNESSSSSSLSSTPILHFIVGDQGFGKTTKMKKIFDQNKTNGSKSQKWISGGGIAAMTSSKEKIQFLRSLEAEQQQVDVLFFDDIHLFLPTASSSSAMGSDEIIVSVFHSVLKNLNHVQEIYCSVSSSSPSSSSSSGNNTTGSKIKLEDILPREILSLSSSIRKVESEYLTLPSTSERIEILSAAIRSCVSENRMNSISEETIQDLASSAFGYSPLDFNVLVDVATALHLKEESTASTSSSASSSSSSSTALFESCLRRARRLVQPAALKSINAAPPPSLSWVDIGGSDEAKQSLQECLAFANEKAQLAFSRFGVSAPRGVLLFGPPGNSKTMLAKAVASAGKMNFISVKGPEVFSRWVGMTELAIRSIFERARTASPCVIFIDELDGMCGKRGGGGVGDRVIAQLLVELDGMPKNNNNNHNNNSSSSSSSSSSGIVFIAATNRPDCIDPAVLRPGRIDRKVYVGLPSEKDRGQIIRIALKGIPLLGGSEKDHDDNDVVSYLDQLARDCEGYTGAELVSLCKRAAALAVYENTNADFVEKKHFEQAKREVQPRIQKKDIDWYIEWARNN